MASTTEPPLRGTSVWSVCHAGPRPPAQAQEVEFVFEPQDEGGHHVYAPDLPGLHTQGETLEEATDDAREALGLYVEGLREERRRIGTGVMRRKLPPPA